jgi:hypothetical protein
MAPGPVTRPAPALPETRSDPVTEEEFEARVIEDPAFADLLFAKFLDEADPVRMSFLQNVIASNPKLRNDARWQERFMTVAESDARRERRIAALLFLEQAEAISSVRDRMFALAEAGEIREHALVALKGLPDRRLPDARLAALARRIADEEPALRGLALRIEDDPAHAARYLSDPDREVRAQAAQVAGREALERARAAEEDAEVRSIIERRLGS